MQTTQGTITALNGAVTVAVGDQSAVAVQLTGTWTATHTFQATVDGTNWADLPGTPIAGGAAVTSATANGQWQFNVAGFSQFRVTRTLHTSGTTTVTIGVSAAGEAASGATIALPAASLGSGPSAAALRTVLATDGSSYTSQPTVTRPANTTPYSDGDVVGGAIEFTNIGPAGGHVLITSADLEIDVAAVPSGMTSFRLYLYSVTPPSAVADNGAFDLPSGDRVSFLGYVDLGTPVDIGSTLYVQNDNVNRKIGPLTTTSVFGYLRPATGYTPAGNSEVYKPRLHALGV